MRPLLEGRSWQVAGLSNNLRIAPNASLLLPRRLVELNFGHE
jgi:hypothetical protein